VELAVDPEPGPSLCITITKTLIIISPDELIESDIEIYVFSPGPVINEGKPLRPAQFFGNLQPPTDGILFYYTLKRPSQTIRLFIILPVIFLVVLIDKLEA